LAASELEVPILYSENWLCGLILVAVSEDKFWRIGGLSCVFSTRYWQEFEKLFQGEGKDWTRITIL
jgi:hypothetical protein